MFRVLTILSLALVAAASSMAAPSPDFEALKEKLAPNTALLFKGHVLVGPVNCTKVVPHRMPREQAAEKAKASLSKAIVTAASPSAGNGGDLRLPFGDNVISLRFPANSLRVQSLALAILDTQVRATPEGLSVKWDSMSCLVGEQTQIVVTADGHYTKVGDGETQTILGERLQEEFRSERRAGAIEQLDRLFHYLTELGRLTGDVRANLIWFRRNAQNAAVQLTQSQTALELLQQKRLTPLFAEVEKAFPESQRLRYARQMRDDFLQTLK